MLEVRTFWKLAGALGGSHKISIERSFVHLEYTAFLIEGRPVNDVLLCIPTVGDTCEADSVHHVRSIDFSTCDQA